MLTLLLLQCLAPRQRRRLLAGLSIGMHSRHDRALKALFTPKTLKPRKKEYLKRRKLKRKGSLAGDGSSKEEELEASLAARDVKPAFGEVAKQPLKASPSYQALQSGPQRHMDSFLAIQLNHPILPRL